jgi:ribonuclease HI
MEEENSLPLLKPMVLVHSDGSVLTNPGIGGWAALLESGDDGEGTFRHQKRISGASPHATNNQMELQAVIEAIMALKKPADVTIVTDSQYLANGINNWFPEWRAAGKALNKGIMNPDMWHMLYLFTQNGQHTIHAEWVRGHSKHPKNDEVDKLAYNTAKAFRDASSQETTPATA